MKTFNIFASILITITVVSCSSKNSNNSSDSSNAVCVWDNISLVDAPSQSGKWLCSLSIGETVFYLDDTKEDNSGKKTVKFYNVRLKDGKEGWVQSDFFILGSKAAAITEKAEIYSRPDLLNKTGNYFSRMDIIAVKSEMNGFIEVSGKRKDGKWIETGWLKTNAITYADYDIALAKFARKIISITDQEKRNEEVMKIMKDPDLSKSIFTEDLPGTSKPVEVEFVETTPADTTNKSN